MKPDLYTKAILTVIAAALIALSVNGLSSPALAQADAQRVVVVGWERALPVIVVDDQGRMITSSQGVRVNVGGQPVPVTLGNQTVPVSLRAIERTGAWQPIQVDVLKTPPSPVPGP
jgi:hypothetical protein